MRLLMIHGAACLALASLCSISAEGTEAAGAGGAAPADESIGEVLADDLKSAEAFIANTATTLVEDAEKAGAWLLDELKALEPAVLSDLKAAVQAAANEAVAGSTSGSIVADTLTILARDGGDLLAAIKSDVLEAVVGLTTATPAP